MRRAISASIVMLLWAAGPAARAESDPKAVAIADQVMEALGGGEAWRNTRYLRFDFAVDAGGKTVVRRAHTWDKWTGRYRFESPKEGSVVLMNINSKEGTVYSKGKLVAGAAAKKALDEAYEAWVNDTYWLLMPYKMKDPGVHLALDGQASEGKVTYDKVLLTFDNVGLTPKDRYWAWINRDTHLMDKWEFLLQGAKPPAEPFLWKNWQRHGKVLLSDEKVSPKNGTRIYFPVLETPSGVPDSVFASAAGAP